MPLDGSKTAERVLPYARYLARNFRVPVKLIAVIDLADIQTYIPVEKAGLFDTVIENRVRTSEAYLKKIALTFDGAGIKCAVLKGRVQETIVNEAEDQAETLIAMTTHGRSGLDRWLLGSVTEKTLRSSVNPLLVIRSAAESQTAGEAPLKSVLVPLDGSPLAESVLWAVAEIEHALGLAVTLLRIYNVPYSVYGYGHGYYAIDTKEFMAEARFEASEYLEKKANDIKKIGVGKVVCVTKQGHSADEIIKFARETPGTLILMCSHGRSGVSRWMLGSVAETVVRHSDHPVLVLRPAIPPTTETGSARSNPTPL